MIRGVRKKVKASERSACRCFDQPRSTQRYKAQQRNGERVLCERMRELALRHPRYGYRMITVLLREEGFQVNKKRVHRLWRKEGLKVPQKQHKKRRLSGSSANSIVRHGATHPNHVWSFDFCQDRTADGRSLRIFSVLDEFTRRCLTIQVERRFTGADVVSVLKELMKMHGAPDHVRCDNGPEFVCDALRNWAKRSSVGTLYIEPGSPWENGIVESYHARLRDELLNREEFASLIQAKALLAIWRVEYNEQRPHGSLGYKTPAGFFESYRRAEPCSAALRMARHADGVELVETVAH
jgi:putative transposase